MFHLFTPYDRFILTAEILIFVVAFLSKSQPHLFNYDILYGTHKMTNRIAVMVFDLGNVLLPFEYQKIIDRLEHVEGGLGRKFADYYKSNYEIHRNFERGLYSIDEFVGIAMGVLENKVGREDFCQIYSKIFAVNEELVAVLPTLKRNYRLVLLSNTNAIHEEYGWRGYGFIKYFDKLILSQEVGAVKPEGKIYEAVESFTRSLPQEHFYVDDVPAYVAAAKERGWDAVQFVGNQELFREFDKRVIKWTNEKAV